MHRIKISVYNPIMGKNSCWIKRGSQLLPWECKEARMDSREGSSERLEGKSKKRRWNNTISNKTLKK